jgi:vitamin B12 transporter
MNPVVRLAALSAAISLSLSVSTAHAAAATELDTVQVTATRVERPVDEALASVTVLTRAEIEASQAPDLIDLLGRQAGLDVARTGGPGAASTVFMRGGNGNHTLVLIDGIRVNSTGQGLFDFAHLPLEQIERIEIVRGPRAAVWGSDALSGVIHVFTRDPADTSVRLTAGSDRLRDISFASGWGSDARAIGFTAGYGDADGFSATNSDSFSYDPDEDGYRNRNLSVRGRTEVGSHVLAFTALGTDGDVQFDQGFTSARVFTNARNVSGGISLAGELMDRWHHQLTVGHAREDLDTQAGFANQFHSRRTSVDWVNHLRTGADAGLRFGLNWQREEGSSSNVFDPDVFAESRSSRALFAGYGGRFGAHVLDVAVRHDDSSQFGAATTGSAGWGWDVTDALQLRLSWGEGFRAPNFNELYYPDGGFGYAGNPDLHAERSRTWEAGLDLRPAEGHRFGLSVYRSRVRDLIAFAAPVTNNAINIARAELDGVELEYRFDRGGWTAGGNATWQEAENADTGLALLRRADRKAHADVGYRWSNGFELGVDADYVSDRPDFGADLDAFTLVHLRAAWQFAPAWRIEGRVENVGDRDYAWAYGYNTPDRSAMLSLVWNAAR